MLGSCELSREKVLLALVVNSHVLCKGVQSMRGREKPKLHERNKRSKAVKITKRNYGKAVNIGMFTVLLVSLFQLLKSSFALLSQ